MPDGTIEIITGRERLRRWSAETKARIVAESHEPGARVCDVAARHDVCPSLLHGWRRLAREGRAGGSGFVPVRLVPSRDEPVTSPPSRSAFNDQGTPAIEVVLPSGGRVLVRHDASLPMLRAVITALRG